MADYTPDYRKAPPLTIEHFDVRVEELPPILAYAGEHDDVLVLDELFCRIVTLEHRIVRWEREHESRPRVASSLKELDRALKWAWLARDEEDHAGGMYAQKLKEAIDILWELQVFLHSERNREAVPVDTERNREPAPVDTAPEGMTREEAEALAGTIKARLPQAEVEVIERSGAWAVEAKNPRRGTSHVFASAEEFEQLMQGTRT